MNQYSHNRRPGSSFAICTFYFAVAAKTTEAATNATKLGGMQFHGERGRIDVFENLL